MIVAIFPRICVWLFIIRKPTELATKMAINFGGDIEQTYISRFIEANKETIEDSLTEDVELYSKATRI